MIPAVGSRAYRVRDRHRRDYQRGLSIHSVAFPRHGVLAKGGDDRLLRHSTVVSIQDESYPLKNKRRAGLTQGVKSGSGMINGLVQVGPQGLPLAARQIHSDRPRARAPPVDSLDSPKATRVGLRFNRRTSQT